MNNIPSVLQELFLKNLKFFKTKNPQIHQVLTEVKPDHSKIIITDDGKIDLIYKGKKIYGGDAIDYVEKEVSEFRGIYKEDKRTSSLTTITPGLYTSPRFFHSHLDQTILELYKAAEELEPNTIHHYQRHDFVIVTGIGLGLHISELLDRIDIQNILILETDYELLSLSCFFTDWEEIYNKQSPKLKKSISLVLLNNKEIETEIGSLWNELIKRAPHFPFGTITYNHGRHDKYGEILERMNSDVTMFISLWGFYDDEANQLNHVMHNINNQVKLIPKKIDFDWNAPVIVCGSGPSLDSRIELIKSLEGNCIVVSAGSSLHALLKYEIIPDYHVELESDYGVYHVLNVVEKKYRDQITLICALQCTPLITNLFKETYVFVKDSMSIGDIFEKQEDKLKESTPTCVNAALSFAFQFKSPEILLFGTDFGFYDLKNHHSKKSFYIDNEENNSDVNELKEISEKSIKNTITKDGYNGDCLTTATYFTTKRRIEMSIILNSMLYKFNVYNNSDGLIIGNTTHIPLDGEIKLNSNFEKEDIKNKFKENSRETNSSLNEKIAMEVHSNISKLCRDLASNIEKIKPNTEALSSICWAISNHIHGKFQKENGSLAFFIRGTMWHYMLAGYSIAYACKKEKQKHVIEVWKSRIIDFLNTLPDDLYRVLNKERGPLKDDPQLKKTIREKTDC
jgi:hypothetical protein